MANRLKTGDDVVVIAGKNKGSRGRVLRVLDDVDRVLIEGVNMVTKHEKRNPQNPQQGGRTQREAPIHVSNVMPWSESDGKGVRIRQQIDDAGRKTRVSTASGVQVGEATGATKEKNA